MNVQPYAHRFRSFLRRNGTTIPLLIIALCILAIFTLQAVTINRLQDEIAAQNSAVLETRNIAKQISDDSKERNKQIQDLNRHLDCIVKFFSQADRSERAIEDIDTCRVTSTARASQPSMPAQAIDNSPGTAAQPTTHAAKQQPSAADSRQARPTTPPKPAQPVPNSSPIDVFHQLLGGLL